MGDLGQSFPIAEAREAQEVCPRGRLSVRAVRTAARSLSSLSLGSATRR